MASGLSSNMIEVCGAYKRYGSQQPILRGLNMTVAKGSIYGLLGPSGCGKTTLLSCIVGRRHLDDGLIKLGVTRRRHVGYMPQDVALFPEFKISEIFNFYGKLYGLDSATLEKRASELSSMLEIPKPSRIVNTLSGGQQRRVSLAVALLHNPQLLILDEPTVGVDPVLCHTIWIYLVKLAKEEKKTVVITTHYIEEAKQSDTIGLMRKGVLLSEESPTSLMLRNNCTNLEEAFLLLSKKQHENNCSERFKGVAIDYPKVPLNSAPSPLPNRKKFSKDRFMAQLVKNLIWTQRNVPILLFLLLLPAIECLLFGATFGRDPENLSIGLISDELPYIHGCATNLVYNYTYSDLLECDVPTYFTCPFLFELKKTLDVRLYDNVKTATMAVNSNEVWGYLHISKNFTPSVEERIAFGINTNDDSIDNSVISMSMDMSNFILSNIIRRDVATSLQDFLKTIVSMCGINPDVVSVPLKMNGPVYGTMKPVFAHSTVSGFICAFAFYFTLMFTSGAIMMEKVVGLMERSMVAGMTKVEIILAHMVVQFILMTAQTFVMLMVLYEMYDNPFNGNLYLGLTILYGVEFVGVTFGFMLSEIFKEEKMVSYAGIGMIITIFLLSGSIWPLEGGHRYIKSWSLAFPIVAPIQAYNSVTNRGFGITDQTVYLGLVSCAAWISIFSFIAYYLSRTRKGS